MCINHLGLAHLGDIWCGSLVVKHVRSAHLALGTNLVEKAALKMMLERSIPDRN